MGIDIKPLYLPSRGAIKEVSYFKKTTSIEAIGLAKSWFLKKSYSINYFFHFDSCTSPVNIQN